jgi:hypothetical protein
VFIDTRDIWRVLGRQEGGRDLRCKVVKVDGWSDDLCSDWENGSGSGEAKRTRAREARGKRQIRNGKEEDQAVTS